jgi:hypothetical protein
VKTYKFCSEECSQKHIRDNGLIDGDAVEDLLKEIYLMLGTAITKWKLPGSRGLRSLAVER